MWRITYDPGTTSNKASSFEYTTEITQVINLAGAILYTYKDSDGDEFQNYLDAESLLRVGSSMKSWKVSQREPRTLLPFPPCPGVSWKNQYVAQYLPSGAVYQFTEVSKIESANEPVSVPAGNFAQALKEVANFERVPQGSQTGALRFLITYWWVPDLGPVRSVEEYPQTQERRVWELLSTFTPTSSK